MKKRLISLLLAVVLAVSLLAGLHPAVSAATGDEIRAARKIISVAYDDSGSMSGNRWVYANYAMQALTALLNEQDSLYLTYMSSPYTAREMDLRDIVGAVEDIRDWDHSGGTPEAALDTAYDKLAGLSESDSSTQFWLVIMTDGEIGDMSETMQQKLNSFKGRKMSNGSTLNVVYLAMGSSKLQASADPSNGLYTYYASDAKSITGVMSEIANLISGRITATNVQQVDDTTIRFSSALPLYSISVLSQESSASVINAESQEGQLNLNRNIALSASDPFGSVRTKLQGNAAVIDQKDVSGANAVIPAGTYTITFSEAVKLEDLVVQYEPAIGMKMVITKNGVEVTDPATLLVTDKVSIEIIPVVPGTDTVIDPADLPNGLTWNLEYEVDGTVENSANDSKLSNVKIQDGYNLIRGTMNIPGFAASVYEVGFTVMKIVYHFGIEVDQPDSLSYLRGNLNSRTGSGDVTFWLTNDGVRLSKEAQQDIGVGLDITDTVCDSSNVEAKYNYFGKFAVGGQLKRNDDGSYTLTPSAPPFVAFLLTAGDYTVTVCVNQDQSVTATGRFTLVPQMSDYADLFWLLIVLALLALFAFLLFRPHFASCTICYECYSVQSDGTAVLKASQTDSRTINYFTGFLSIGTACSTTYHDMVLRAKRNGGITITKGSISRNTFLYGTSDADPVERADEIMGGLDRTVSDDEEEKKLRASNVTLSPGSPFYFTRTADTKTLECIYIME